MDGDIVAISDWNRVFILLQSPDDPIDKDTERGLLEIDMTGEDFVEFVRNGTNQDAIYALALIDDRG